MKIMDLSDLDITNHIVLETPSLITGSLSDINFETKYISYIDKYDIEKNV